MRKNKNTLLYTQNQSMLVSERKTNNENYITHPSQQTFNKVTCNCEKRLSVIETKLEMLSLSIDQMTSHINISYTKHMESYSKMTQQKKQRENLEHTIWQLKQENKSYFQKYTTQSLKSKQQLKGLQDQVQGWTRMLREVKNWKNCQTKLSSELQKQFVEIIDRHKSETDQKLRKMFNAIQQIGILQRKMLFKGQNQVQQKSRTYSTKQRHSIGGRKNSVWNQSTLIASRNAGYC